ncbi:MAG: twin-arginine translocase subunit TatC [Sedimentisphaeraceae bacterium JB056]
MSKNEEKLESMSLGEHLEDLRYRLIMAISGILGGFVVCLFFGKFILKLASMPYKKAMESAGLDATLQAIQPSEQFVVYVKCALVFGIVLAAPWIFYHLWKFIAPGLYKKEVRFIHTVSPLSAALFMAGSIFFITVIAPMALSFFINFETGIEFVEVNVTLQNYINFILSLTLIFGLAFQLPIAIIFAEMLGLVTIEMLNKGRKIVIMALVVIAAIVTPPDIISQIALACPLYILYELSIAFCLLTRKRRKKKAIES